ncbi:hypothetical protein [Actinopolymorpha pittospori]|uniref:Uncharacterized protein n=1 Tax=Actinopolymorpha pittospori TaxID=648752 RepID=A0A927MX70_9ACTN|nr:hypothetical protein [Actinopolymorpha pittospori]MBE1606938.1 hypothetical protein [Actinopolymorpha pittospori]
MHWIDWDENSDPYFYENHHTPPVPLHEEDGVVESWIFYGSPKFSGKRLFLSPGARYQTSENRGSSASWSGRVRAPLAARR